MSKTGGEGKSSGDWGLGWSGKDWSKAASSRAAGLRMRGRVWGELAQAVGDSEVHQNRRRDKEILER